MRTQQEILDRIIVASKRDSFGFEWHEYLEALTRKSARSLVGTLLKDDIDLKKWKYLFHYDNDIKTRCIEYMPFAWEKANGCRGISAARSLMHYKAWLWLMGSDEFEDIDEYQFYGKDNLITICQYLGLDAKQWDDGERSNEEY